MQEHWRGGGFDNGKKKVVFCQWEVHLVSQFGVLGAGASPNYPPNCL